MKIIQTRNKFSDSQLDNINISNELFVEAEFLKIK